MRPAARTVSILALLACALAAPAASAPVARSIPQPDSLLPLAVLLAPPTNQAPELSPDGRWVSFLRPVDGALNLFVAPAESAGAARPITHLTGRGLQAYDVSGVPLAHWTPDSRRILFPVDHDGDEKWNLHVVDVATGAEKTLTDMPGTAVEFQRFSDEDPNAAAVLVRERPGTPDLYRLDLGSGERTLIMKNDSVASVVPDRALRPRLGIKVAADGSLDFYRWDGSGWKLLWDVSLEDTPAINTTSYQKAFSWDRANNRFFLYSTEGRDATTLVALDATSGVRTPVLGKTQGDIAHVLYHPVTGEPIAYATMWTRTTWTAVDPAVREDLARLARVADGDFEVLGVSRDLGRWLVAYTLSDAPVAYYVYEHASGRAWRLFTGTPALEGLKLSKLHPFEIRSSDGLPLVSYYLLPRWRDPDGDGMPDQPLPAVVLVHGGPGDERAQWAFGPFLHWLANRGYAVLYLNYRGSPGFGKKFLNAEQLEWGGRMNRDLVEQVDWAAKRGIVRRDQVAIMGGSYGGYATLAGMTLTPGAFACGVSLVGPSNLSVFLPGWNVDRMAKRVGDPRTEAGRKHLYERSPVNFAQNTKGPVLIGQGEHDSRVPTAQSDTIVSVMRRAGVPVVYAVYPDEGHGFLRPENSRSFWAITEAFFAKCLGGRASPLDDALVGSSAEIRSGVEFVPGRRHCEARGATRGRREAVARGQRMAPPTGFESDPPELVKPVALPADTL